MRKNNENTNNVAVNNSEVKKFDFPNFLISEKFRIDLLDKKIYTEKQLVAFKNLDISKLLEDEKQYGSLLIKNLIFYKNVLYKYDFINLKIKKSEADLEKMLLELKKAQQEFSILNDVVLEFSIQELAKNIKSLEKKIQDLAEKRDVLNSIYMTLNKYSDFKNHYQALFSLPIQEFEIILLIESIISKKIEKDFTIIFEKVLKSCQNYGKLAFKENIDATAQTSAWKAYTLELDNFLKLFEVEKDRATLFNARKVSYNETEKRNIASIITDMKPVMTTDGVIALDCGAVDKMNALLIRIILMKKQGVKVVYAD